MKQILYLFAFILYVLPIHVKAQESQGFHYQAVARDDNGSLLADTDIRLRFQIRQQNPSGPLVYQELHTLRTNSLGMVQTSIGKGTTESGSFESIEWSQQNLFLSVELEGQLVDVSPFEGVPYAKMATEMKLDDLQNVDVRVPGTGDVLQWDGNAWVPGPRGGDQYRCGFWHQYYGLYHQ